MIVDFVQQNSKAAATQKYRVSESRPRRRIFTATGTHSWDLWAVSLHKRPLVAHQTLWHLLFSTNFVILP